MTGRPPAKERLKLFFKKYGAIALVIYLAIFGVVFAGFVLAISTGISTEETEGAVAVVGTAWFATKLTQPLRIGATVLLTPLIARLLNRRAVEPPDA